MCLFFEQRWRTRGAFVWGNMWCCRRREKLPNTPAVVLLHVVDAAQATPLADDFAKLTGTQCSVVSPTGRYLPGDPVPASLKSPTAGARLSHVMRAADALRNDGATTVIPLAGPWHHWLGPAAEGSAGRDTTSAVLYTPLAQAITMATEDPLAVLLRFLLLFRGEEDHSENALGNLTRGDVDKALECVRRQAPNGKSAAVSEALAALRTAVVLPALGLDGSQSRVHVVPRHPYDVTLQQRDRPAAQLRDHLQSRLLTRRPSVLTTAALYQHPDAPLSSCDWCHLRDSLGFPPSSESSADTRMGGTNLRLSNTPLSAGAPSSWFDTLTSSVGQAAVSALRKTGQVATDALGLAPAELREAPQAYYLNVPTVHEGDPEITVEFTLSVEPDGRDYIVVERAEEPDRPLLSEWTHGVRTGVVRWNMPREMKPGAYLARYYSHSQPVGHRAFLVYPEDHGVCTLFDKIALGRNQLGGDLQNRVTDIVWDCTGLFRGLDRKCVADKVMDQLGVTTPCANCFAKLSQCGRENCAWRCSLLGVNSRTCRSCVQSACGESFASCIGIPAFASDPNKN